MRSPSEVGLRDTFHKCSWAWSATVRPLLRRDAQERKGHVRPALQSTRLLPWAGIVCVRVDSSTRRTMMTFDSIDVSFYPPILHESRCRPHRRRLYPMTPLRQTDRSPLHAASAGVFDEPNAVRAGWSCPEWQRLVAVPSCTHRHLWRRTLCVRQLQRSRVPRHCVRGSAPARPVDG
jgi:hypothetical protein